MSVKGSQVLSLEPFERYAKSGMLEYVVVEDVVTGDWATAVKGVDVVCHVASPVSM
jgi:hypothetical protein